MKKNPLLLYCLIAFWLFSACEKEDHYPTSIIRDYNLFLNEKPWSPNVGLSTRPLFIYGSDGSYVANYSSFYNIALDNGTYRFLATPNGSILIPDSVLSINLNNLIIKQPVSANMQVQISPVVNYSSPFKETLQLHIVNQTGTLRLRAKDQTADLGYKTVRAIVGVNRTGYKVSDQTYTEAYMELTHSKATATGGVNYTDDFIVFETKDELNGITVRLELLDSDGQVVRTKELGTKFEVYPNEVTLAEFYLNE